jgi:hypothetical protein
VALRGVAVNGGIDHTPWYVRVFMIFFTQICLAATQYLVYLQEGGIWATLGLAALQVVTAVAGVFGPGAAGSLARNVGRALKIGKNGTDVTVPPKDPL